MARPKETKSNWKDRLKIASQTSRRWQQGGIYLDSTGRSPESMVSETLYHSQSTLQGAEQNDSTHLRTRIEQSASRLSHGHRCKTEETVKQGFTTLDRMDQKPLLKIGVSTKKSTLHCRVGNASHRWISWKSQSDLLLARRSMLISARGYVKFL